MEVPAFNSFKDILTHYRKFLKGKIDGCPTHDGPLEEESMLILPELLKINKSVLTVDSQPGLIEDTREETCKQRAYVDCFMSKKQYTKLSQLLMANTDLMVFGRRYKKASKNPPQILIPVTIFLTTDPTDSFDVDVQVEVHSAMPLNWLSQDMELILSGTSTEKQAKILKDLYSVRILDPIWGRQKYLFENVVAALK